jgi:hypothetical protein
MTAYDLLYSPIDSAVWQLEYESWRRELHERGELSYLKFRQELLNPSPLMEAMYRGELERYFLEVLGEPYENFIQRMGYPNNESTR